MTQKLKVYIVQGFANKGNPYYSFNYVEKHRNQTSIVKVHKDHPIFKKMETPKYKEEWDEQKYVITADLSPKTKMDFGVNCYIYDPEIKIQNLEKVKQCWDCQHDADKLSNYEPCNCPCEGVEDECLCCKELADKVEVPLKK